MRDVISELAASTGEFSKHWVKFSSNIREFRGPNGFAFDFDEVEPQDNIAFQDLAAKVSLIQEFQGALSASTNAHSAPKQSIKRIKGILDEASKVLKEADDKFQAITAAGAGPVDAQELIISSIDGVTKIELGALWRNLYERLDSGIYEFGIISHFFRVDGVSTFGARWNEMDRILRSAEKDAQKVQVTKEKLAESIALQKTLIDQFNQDMDEIERMKEEAAEALDTLKAGAESLQIRVQQTESSIANAAPILEKANQLRAEVETHKAFIEQHKGVLQGLREVTDGHLESAAEIENRILGAEEKIGRQILDAEKMLKGATVAGLAGEFGTIRDSLSSELRKARNAVVWSTWGLFLSVLPILLYIFGPALGIAINGDAFDASNPANALVGLFMRSVLLIPATWYARFAARRYDRIFKLREHYAYKYSLATAVEGFKKQAPAYEDDIAAETFYELTFNPADKLDQHRSKAQELPRRESLVRKKIKEMIEKKNVAP